MPCVRASVCGAIECTNLNALVELEDQIYESILENRRISIDKTLSGVRIKYG